MKIQKVSLDLLSDEEPGITIGLIRLVKNISANEVFYALNLLNDYNFSRIEDMVVEGEYFNYNFLRFEGHHNNTGSCLTFISNKSVASNEKKEQNMLFPQEGHIKFLLPNHEDADYLLTANDGINDFSLILLPENLMFQIQEFPVAPHEELYSLIQYYE